MKDDFLKSLGSYRIICSCFGGILYRLPVKMFWPWESFILAMLQVIFAFRKFCTNFSVCTYLGVFPTDWHTTCTRLENSLYRPRGFCTNCFAPILGAFPTNWATTCTCLEGWFVSAILLHLEQSVPRQYIWEYIFIYCGNCFGTFCANYFSGCTYLGIFPHHWTTTCTRLGNSSYHLRGFSIDHEPVQSREGFYLLSWLLWDILYWQPWIVPSFGTFHTNWITTCTCLGYILYRPSQVPVIGCFLLTMYQ